jgi:hypothetical protein
MKQNLNGIRFSMSNFQSFCAGEVGWQSGFEYSGGSADEGFLRELPIRLGCKQTLWPGEVGENRTVWPEKKSGRFI